MNLSPTHTEMDTSKLAAAIAEVQDTAGRMSQAQPGTSEHGSLEAELREQMEDVVLEIKFLLTAGLYQWFAAMRNAHHLTCRDIFRHAANRSILTLGACERWLRYCDLLGFKQSLSFSPPAPDNLPKLSSSDVQDFTDDAKRLASSLDQKLASDPVYVVNGYE